jgi:hypothetical protein
MAPCRYGPTVYASHFNVIPVIFRDGLWLAASLHAMSTRKLSSSGQAPRPRAVRTPLRRRGRSNRVGALHTSADRRQSSRREDRANLSRRSSSMTTRQADQKKTDMGEAESRPQPVFLSRCRRVCRAERRSASRPVLCTGKCRCDITVGKLRHNAAIG